jgi:hypothetical protein
MSRTSYPSCAVSGAYRLSTVNRARRVGAPAVREPALS